MGSDKQQCPPARAGRRLSSPCTNPASSVVLLTGSASQTAAAPQAGSSVGGLQRGQLPEQVLGGTAVLAGCRQQVQLLRGLCLGETSWLAHSCHERCPPSSPSQHFSLQAPSGFLWTEDRLPVGFSFFYFSQAQSRRTKKGLYHLDNQTTQEC